MFMFAKISKIIMDKKKFKVFFLFFYEIYSYIWLFAHLFVPLPKL